MNADNLPPALTEPLPAADAIIAKMPRGSAALARQLIAGRDVFLIVRTGTKVDVGSWLFRGRIWLAVLDDGLAAVASAPGGARPLAEIVPFHGLRRSRYNHVTGQLVLAPTGLAGTKGLAMSPIEGCQVLAQIYHMR
jgi:hypothetical protein